MNDPAPLPTASPIHRLLASPLWVRIVPFLIFLCLTGLQGKFGEASRYWFYLVKTVVGAGMVWAVWPWITEMRWTWSWDALVVGVAVFGLWIGLDEAMRWLDASAKWHRLPGPALPWNPPAQFGEGSGLAWLMITIRLTGVVLVVPPLEEVFYRSCVYRYLIDARFESVPLNRFDARSFLITSLAFALTHGEWLAALLCGFAYQGLVLRKGRLGDAILAHSITNLLLGLWVVFKGAWEFW